MDKYKRNGYLMIANAGILWGSLGIFISFLNSTGIESLSIAFCRLFFGFVLLIPVVILQLGPNGFKIDGSGLLACFFLGVVSQALFNYSYVQTIKLVGLSTGAVLLYTSPIFVTLMARVFYKEYIHTQKLISLCLCISGCFMAVTGGNIASMKFSPFGIFLGLTSGFTYAIMTIVSKKLTRKYESLTIILYSFLFGWMAMIPSLDITNILAASKSYIFFINAIGIGLFPAAGAYFLYMKGLSRELEASNVSIISSLEIVVSILIGLIIFHEHIGFGNAMGMFLVLLSLVVINSSQLFGKLLKSKA